MDSTDEKFIVLEQYKVYSDAKEKFIDRQFTTNRFYLVFNVFLLAAAYFLSTLTPQYQPVIVLTLMGMVVSLLWWMNIDSYQLLIKVKYANVLEYLETKLPEQPFHKEYVEHAQYKKSKGVVVFGDFQKALAFGIACVYFSVFINNLTNWIRYSDIFIK